MAQLRKEYTQEDKELIKEISVTRRSSQKSEPPGPVHIQKILVKEEAIFGESTSLSLSLSLSYIHISETIH